MGTNIQTTGTNAKKHYLILDALRGVAALIVLWYHVFEGYATSHHDQIVNHGYLAVDFFFILSGYVIAYAYDDRWKTMSKRDFLERRIIRLQPMVILGAIIGAIMFYTQKCDWWNVSVVSLSSLLIATVMNIFMIPATPSIEIRGIGEMYPLNGPTWSLFFEYIGNILYGLFIHKLSNKALTAIIIAVGIGLFSYVILGPDGDIGYGWQLTFEQGILGFSRMLFSFSIGLLMFRLVRPGQIKGSFIIAASLLIIFLAMPRIGDENSVWENGIYELCCILFLFPLIVYIGISGSLNKGVSMNICKFLGEISYPLYTVHYPFIYLYIAWIKNGNLPFSESWIGAIGVMIISILISILSVRYYDKPIRIWITQKKYYLKGNKEQQAIAE